MSACRPLAERAGVAIENHAALDCAVKMDRERLSHVFQNLLENAIHHA
nr:HAMP domain-containing histidine kinase [Burkholderiales bacterium]